MSAAYQMGEISLKKIKRYKKITVIIGGILAGSTVICGCGGREDAKKSIKIGISVYDQYDTFVSEMMKDFNDYATKKEEETGILSVGFLLHIFCFLHLDTQLRKIPAEFFFLSFFLKKGYTSCPRRLDHHPCVQKMIRTFFRLLLTKTFF